MDRSTEASGGLLWNKQIEELIDFKGQAAPLLHTDLFGLICVLAYTHGRLHSNQSMSQQTERYRSNKL